MKKPAKQPRFRVGQLVGLVASVLTFGRVHKRRWFDDHYSYCLFPTTEHIPFGWWAENDIRPLTAREIGPRRKAGKRQ